MSNNLLVTQSFIVDNPNTYWDYRDYVFSLCSNLSIKDDVFRLNIERGAKWSKELELAANFNKFSNFEITTITPNSWSEYIINQINNNNQKWTMLFPGDHIYINSDKNLLVKLLQKAEKIDADAIAYGHIQDWDYLLDWEIIDVLYEDEDVIMINWGHKYKFCYNHKLSNKALKKIKQFLIVPPVPGYLIYRSDFLIKILEAIPFPTKRWQDMEYSPAQETNMYKILIPKKCLYRHVHGYWLEIFFKFENKNIEIKNKKEELENIYLRTEYDWKINSPTIDEYKNICLKHNPYYYKYFKDINNDYSINYKSPFNIKWHQKNKLYDNIYIYIKKIFYIKILNYLLLIRNTLKK